MIEEDPAFEVIREGTDGIEAVQICRELRPDLVVLDVGLPKLSGLEAARQIREVSPDTKILFVSGVSSQEVIGEALRIGAVGYIVKLNAPRHLLTAVRAAVVNGEFLRSTALPDPGAEIPEE
jgi:DNA-binding NarL/FixJ family response regulator